MSQYLIYNFDPGSNEHRYPAAYQYDVNREALITIEAELDSYESIRCEFSYDDVPGLVRHETIQVEPNTFYTTSQVYRFTCPVPDVCFQYPGLINVYVCEITNTIRRTLGHFCIRVIGRPKPSTSS